MGEIKGKQGGVVGVFNTTFNNMSVISWQSVLLVEETGISEENPPICRKSHSVISSTPPHKVSKGMFGWYGYEKKDQTVMFNNFTDITCNKTNSHFSPQATEYDRTTTYGVGNVLTWDRHTHMVGLNCLM